MTADLDPKAFLDFCERERRGEVVLRSVSVTDRNGVWRVDYEEVKKPNLELPAQPPTSPLQTEGGAKEKSAPLLPAIPATETHD
jgi:hypothetical protein